MNQNGSVGTSNEISEEMESFLMYLPMVAKKMISCKVYRY